LNFARAVAVQAPVHFLQPADEIEDLFARERSARRLAKVRAAAERPVGVYQAATGLAFEQRTVAVGGFGKVPAPGGSKALGGDERLAFGELRRQAGEPETATPGPRPAGTSSSAYTARTSPRARCNSSFRIPGPKFSSDQMPKHIY
jgi:hypothetical protein